MNVCLTPRTVSVRAEVYTTPCGSRYCPACGLRWQGDMRVCAVAASEHVGPAVALITITAPGRRYFQWPGFTGTGMDGQAVDWWNGEARGEWRRLHLWASRPIREWAREHAPGWRVLFRSWEYQKRGLLHLHLVMPYGTPEERRATTLYVHNLWSGARAFGFGYVMGGETGARPTWNAPPPIKPADGRGAARYVAKYVASVGAGKEGMVDVAQRTAQRGSVLYISRTLTTATGVTMTGLRARRRIWARHPWARAGGEAWEHAKLIDAVQRGRPPLTQEGVQVIRDALTRTGAVLWADAATGEVCPPTDAPPPAQDGATPPPTVRDGGRVVLSLAPVLLRDPTPAFLGIARTVVEVVCEV